MAVNKDHQRSHALLRINSYDSPLHAINFVTGKRFARAISMILIAVLVFLTVGVSALYLDLNSAITNATVPTLNSHGKVVKATVDPNKGKALDILVIGQDARAGKNGSLIGDTNAADATNHQADTTMVVHIAANRKFIDIVSIPRDSLVSIPSCTTTKGTIPAQNTIMFNSIFAGAYAKAGDISSAASCTMAAVNYLTGLNIQQFVVVDFSGLSTMITALGGVDVCVTQDFSDSYTNLKLKKGLHHLGGLQATQYARVRHGLGDGTDVMRTVRQQYLIKMLLREARNKNLFTQTNELYQMAKAAISSLSLSTGLASTNVLVGLASSLASLNGSSIYSQTVPVQTSTYNSNRVQWAPAAGAVWKKVAADQPLTNSSATSKKAASSSPSTSSSPGSTSSASSPARKVDPNTGLITNADGSLTDPETGGRVDKKSGAIIDPSTGWYIGLAEKYVNYTFCRIKD